MMTMMPPDILANFKVRRRVRLCQCIPLIFLAFSLNLLLLSSVSSLIPMDLTHLEKSLKSEPDLLLKFDGNAVTATFSKLTILSHPLLCVFKRGTRMKY
jgi:hypothetical protein